MKRKIVLASHGGLAAGLLDSASMIIGSLPYDVAIYTLLPGNLAEDYVKELKKEITARSDTEYILLCDLIGASVFSALYSCVNLPNVKLFSGMNLNILLSICLEHPHPLQKNDIDKILKNAQSGIQIALMNDETIEEF